MNPVPFTILQIDDGANCAIVREIRQTINDRAKCSDGRCGEGADPWAQVGDVVGPKGETFKFYPEENQSVAKTPP